MAKPKKQDIEKLRWEALRAVAAFMAALPTKKTAQ
jgi:hypothetical protein